MTSELQTFINHFANEEELRAALEGLLVRREGCSGVRNLHGKDESGKDLIFYESSAVGRPRLNAIVVKLKKISGSASDPSSGARNVLIQCDQALENPLVNTSAQSEWVDKVFVISPDELTPTALNSICGKFSGKASQIEFICGQELLKFFKDVWPDFIFFQPDLLSAHLDNLGKELETDQNISRLAFAHGLNIGTKAKSVYVEPFFQQRKGRLRRGSVLPDEMFFASLSQLNQIGKLHEAFDLMITSLNIVEHLPGSLRQQLGPAVLKLKAWPTKFEREWNEAYVGARAEARAQRKDPPLSVPIPQQVIDSFLNSRECKFAEGVYECLDTLIEQSNETISASTNRADLVRSSGFSTYGSLLSATSKCFPTVEFTEDSVIEWSASELLNIPTNLLITGAPGFGKTSFCRNHFLADLDRFKNEKSKILPLYFSAHRIVPESKTTFHELFLWPEIQNRLRENDSLQVRIYLDGLDEISSNEVRNNILDLARAECTKPRSRFTCIATAREHVGGFSTSWLARLNLSPLSQESINTLVYSWLDGNTDLITKFYSELSESESLVPVLGVPLLATLTVLVFKTLQRLPENRLRLYQMFIDLLLSGWNMAKGLQRNSVYSPVTKLNILTRLAGLMHMRRKKECEVSLIASAVKHVAPLLATSRESILTELVEDGLLLPTGRASYTFPHLSFQEYLAARDATDPSRSEQAKVVKAFLNGDDWYKEVAIFLASMTTNPISMRNWIVELLNPAVRGSSALSESERRAALLISRLSDMFPDCRTELRFSRPIGAPEF